MFGRRIKYSISLSYLKFLNQRNRTMVVHHGLMGSSRNFRSIVKHPSISNYVDSYLIDCRNHGKVLEFISQETLHTQARIRCLIWLMICISLLGNKSKREKVTGRELR